jgi:hypothetical protein
LIAASDYQMPQSLQGLRRMALLVGVSLLAIWREGAAFLVMRRVGKHRSFSLTTAAQPIASKLTLSASGQNHPFSSPSRIIP